MELDLEVLYNDRSRWSVNDQSAYYALLKVSSKRSLVLADAKDLIDSINKQIEDQQQNYKKWLEHYKNKLETALKNDGVYNLVFKYFSDEHGPNIPFLPFTTAQDFAEFCDKTGYYVKIKKWKQNGPNYKIHFFEAMITQ